MIAEYDMNYQQTEIDKLSFQNIYQNMWNLGVRNRSDIQILLFGSTYYPVNR